jgi:hypothetical protein
MGAREEGIHFERYGGVPAERQAAAAAVRTIGGRPVMLELFGGRNADPEDAYLGEVETSDAYIGILGRRYGKPLPSRFSATHTEYLHAEKSGLRIATWCSNADDREGHEKRSSTFEHIMEACPRRCAGTGTRAGAREPDRSRTELATGN